MKKLFIIYLLLLTNLSADDYKLEKIIEGLDSPWSLTFINSHIISSFPTIPVLRLIKIPQSISLFLSFFIFDLLVRPLADTHSTAAR